MIGFYELMILTFVVFQILALIDILKNEFVRLNKICSSATLS